MDLLIATSNPGKVEELQRLLEPLGARLRTLAEYPNVSDVAEDAPTFEENAIAKARYYCAETGLPTIADDGGLEIDALNGWPGVHSRRLFGDGRRATDEEMISEVLRRMEGLPPARRGCQMRSVVAFVTPMPAGALAKAGEGIVLTGGGKDRGTIVEQASVGRVPGFPFRSIFFHPEQGMTTVDAAASGAAAEDVMTHRRDAVRTLLPQLQKWAYTARV
ncbi:MAG: non-canonical purine NTP pyrophosphatase [bacterium]|nr:non-canonical purine NTP pyrophosphatase [bacterium]